MCIRDRSNVNQLGGIGRFKTQFLVSADGVHVIQVLDENNTRIFSAKITDMSNPPFIYTDYDVQNISRWDVSNVTDMSSLFFAAFDFNKDISQWNVQRVTDMSFMFIRAEAFNKDIGAWNVSSVLNMSFMFAAANQFNQDIGGWNVSNVTDLSLIHISEPTRPY